MKQDNWRPMKFGCRGWCKQCRQFDLPFVNEICPECMKKNEELDRDKELLLQMEAGRELDALVAERVMGRNLSAHYCSEIPSRINDPCIEGTDNAKEDCLHLRRAGGTWETCPSKAGPFIPNYSTDIYAAWQVVEKFKDYNCEWNNGEEEGNIFMIFKNATCYEATAETAPLAICRASLLAVMEEP